MNPYEWKWKATHTLSVERHSFTERKFWPAGTPVSVTRVGKGGAEGRSQVRNERGDLAVAFNRELLPIKEEA